MPPYTILSHTTVRARNKQETKRTSCDTHENQKQRKCIHRVSCVRRAFCTRLGYFGYIIVAFGGCRFPALRLLFSSPLLVCPVYFELRRVYMYMHICVCICIYIYIERERDTCIYIYMYTCMYIHIYVYVYVFVYCTIFVQAFPADKWGQHYWGCCKSNELWQIGEKGTPWRFWEDKSRLTGVSKKFLCQKTQKSQRPH